jgi:hypothetical protein
MNCAKCFVITGLVTTLAYQSRALYKAELSEKHAFETAPHYVDASWPATLTYVVSGSPFAIHSSRA